MSETNNIELQVQGGEQPEIRLQVNGLNSKADKVDGATAGNFAGLDETGNLTDSGYKAADFATAEEIGTVPSGQTVEGQITALNANLTQLSNSKADMIVVSDSTEAAVKSFSDGGDDYPMALTVGIEPVQDLHGLDAPYPPGGGKNLIPLTVENIKANNTGGSWSGNVWTTGTGLTVTVNDDGSMIINGTTTATTYINYTTIGTKITVPAGTYTLKAPGIQNINVAVVKDGNYWISAAVNNQTETLAESANLWFYSLIANGKTFSNELLKPMFESGSTAHDWQPYSNICPISGWTGVEVTRCGKNLLNAYGTDTNNGFKDENSLGMYGEYVGSYAGFVTEYFSIPADTVCTLSGISGINTTICFYDDSKTFISAEKYDSRTSFQIQTPAMARYARASVPNAKKDDVQFVIGTDATYEAFTGNHTYPITFPTPPGTVYGGTLTVNKDGTGVLVVDTVKRTFNGSESWGDYASYEGYSLSINNMRKGTRQDGLSNMLKCSKTSDAGQKNAMWLGVNSVFLFVIGVYDSMGATLEDFKTYLSTHNLDVTYPHEDPPVYNLTAEQVGQIKSLLGVNNLWASTGNIKAVEYSADTKLYIDGRIAALLASLQ